MYKSVVVVVVVPGPGLEKRHQSWLKACHTVKHTHTHKPIAGTLSTLPIERQRLLVDFI